jgi:hypothetical protein
MPRACQPRIVHSLTCKTSSLRTLAADMYLAQSEEIGAMQSLLTSLE